MIVTDGSSAGTPKSPTGDGLAISIFGEKDNPKYEDYSSDPSFDTYRNKDGMDIKRPNTSTLKDHSVSDISVRGSPLNKGSWKEILRIAKPGATVTVAGPRPRIERLLKDLEDGKIIDDFQYNPKLTHFEFRLDPNDPQGGGIPASALQIRIIPNANAVGGD